MRIKLIMGLGILFALFWMIAPAYSQVTVRINAGGPDYTDSNGDVFEADAAYTAGGYGFVGGSPLTFVDAIDGTDDDSLYQSLRRHSASFSYLFDDLPVADYRVSLHFSEPDADTTGFRLLDITAEGDTVIQDLDVWAETGAAFTAYQDTVVVNVTDGQLNLNFTVSTGNQPYVCAISVEEIFDPIYEDVTAAVGIIQEHLLDTVTCTAPPISAGAAWADYDNDGLVDLFVTSHGGANHLYHNLGDTDADDLPNFSDVASGTPVELSSSMSIGACFIDYDNDGDQDLYVTNYGGNTLFQNLLIESGSADFVDVTVAAGVADGGRAITSAWADFDNDGYLDFYLAKHYYCITTGIPDNLDALYRNNGDGTFSDVTSYLVGGPHIGMGFAPAFVDFDNDNDLDLYIVNDILGGWYHNVMWRNDGSDGVGGWIFTDVSASSGTDITLNGMGQGVGDYNNDGFFDIAFSNGGSNWLLENNGDWTYSDVSATAGIQRTFTPSGNGSVTWGTVFFDYDLDGWQDLYFVAGPIADNGVAQPNAMFENNQDGTFDDVSVITGLDDDKRGRHGSIVDIDGDGFVDVFVANYGYEPVMFHHRGTESGNTNNWLQFTVEGTESNRDGIGTRLTLSTTDGNSQIREINSGPTHGGGDYRAAFFGMGLNSTATLDVRWPNGQEQTIEYASPNQIVHLVEPVEEFTYEDVTAAVGIVQEHLLDSLTCPAPPISLGSAWADYDNDGLVDLFVTSHGGANHLYRNLGDTDADDLPNFSDVAAGTPVELASSMSIGCVFIDYDNDGDQDLYVTNYGGNSLFQNMLVESGVADFIDVTAIAGVADGGRAITAAWADFDNDGYLDFYLAKHYYCIVTGIPDNLDALYRNNGDGTFSDVTSYLIGGPHIGMGFAPAFVDFDNDNDLDLYIVNDILGGWYPNVMWRNDGPDGVGGWIFTDVSVASGMDITANGMGQGVGDYDNDGDFDVAFSNSGKNWLMQNNGDWTYTDVSAAAGTERTFTPNGDGSVTWGTVFFDEDLDGWQDLFFVAGNIGNFSTPQPNAFFTNNQDGTFTDNSAPSGLDGDGRGRSAAIVDFDGDGYVDVYVGNYGQAPVLYHHRGTETGNTNNWLNFTVEGTESNRDGIGTRITLSTPGGTQMREITSGPTHGGGDARTAFFGLGPYPTANVDIRWPNGSEQTIAYSTVNQTVHLVEPPVYSVSIDIDSSLVPIPAEGDTFQYDLSWTNNSSTVLQMDMWVVRERPTGQESIVLGPKPPVFRANQTISKTPVLRTPADGPAGEYKLIVYFGAFGSFPADTIGSDTVTYTKLAAAGLVADGIQAELIPEEMDLFQNYPNPFNPTTSVRYALNEASQVRIEIYNTLGQKVRTLVNDFQEAGYKTALWDGTNSNGQQVATGIYIYRMQAGDFVKSEKMLFAK